MHGVWISERVSRILTFAYRQQRSYTLDVIIMRHTEIILFADPRILRSLVGLSLEFYRSG
jgi:hypothetical protein